MRVVLILIAAALFLSPDAFSQKKNKYLKTKKINGGIYGPVLEKTDFPDCSYNAWVLEFEDAFDGKDLNYSHWKLPYQGVLAGFDFANSGSKQWYANTGKTPETSVSNNIRVENGVLKLIAVKEPKPIVGSYVTDWSVNPPTRDTASFEYSSAWIESEKQFGYGYYETRCKLPKGKGMWPAFWLFSGKDGFAFEIDIFEFWNESSCLGSYDSNRLSKNPHWNIHSNKALFPTDVTCPTDLCKPCQGQSWSDQGLDADYHVYGLEWDYYKISWYIDGEKVRTTWHFVNRKGEPVTCRSEAKNLDDLYEAWFWPDTETMDVRFNLAVQYNNKNESEKDAVFPMAFEIDYFRYYKQSMKK
ncbi:glycoside hydrolase family 16 protein [Fluviicola sp.]|jgi:beta-glucanase (GH16 family)|uniref:glycoside hydrolase family 16 protein n=1 Tax=Fluviicola sp. TaxID=1917219 RepID=UPI0028270A6E|nr:glycoside hydrolase family 16 protein [Fluviicola sp.]MDR0802280.1 glycoside hydrolase family 16 protein [Fluviicola sp.]